MIDPVLLQRIVGVADVHRKDIILEIGAGTGNLTYYLCKVAQKVYVIEKDLRLKATLHERFDNFPSVNILFGDAIKMTFPPFTKCVSNLPYTLCESLLWKFTRYSYDCLVIVVPQTFAERLIGKKQSRLGLLAEACYNIERIQDVSPNAFDPQPDTMSSLLKITPHKGNFFLRELFLQYDKRTKNAFREILTRSGLTKREACEKIELLSSEIGNKRIVQLSLKEIESIVNLFSSFSTRK